MAKAEAFIHRAQNDVIDWVEVERCIDVQCNAAQHFNLRRSPRELLSQIVIALPACHWLGAALLTDLKDFTR